MKISSSQRRAFFRQTGVFSFLVDLTLPATSGGCEIGFSGDTVLPFNFYNGRITDKSGYFLGSYSANQAIQFSGNVSTTGIDYFINGSPKGLGLPRDQGDLDYFYAHPSPEVDLQLYINGDKPAYSYYPSVSYTTGDSFVPASIINQSTVPFRVFSGQLISESNLFQLSGFPTGIIDGEAPFYILPNQAAGSNELSILMYTDFGTESFTIQASGITDIPPSYNIELLGPSTLQAGTTGIFYCLFSNDSGPISVMPSLDYVSGSGNFDTNTILTGSYSTTISGDITGSALVSQTITVSGSGIGGITEQYVEDTFPYVVQKLIFPTGIFSWDYSILGSGNASLNAYSGPATGLITGTISGAIVGDSGVYSYSGLINKTPMNAYSSQVTGQTKASGLIYYNTPNYNDFLYVGNSDVALAYGISYNSAAELVSYLNSNTGIHYVNAALTGSDILVTSVGSGVGTNSLPINFPDTNVGNMSASYPNLTGGLDLGLGQALNPIGNFEGLLNTTFSGFGVFSAAVSGIATGKNPAAYDSKTFTGTWDMLTGSSLGTLLSSKESNHFSQNSLSGAPFSANVGSFYIYISYNNLFTGNDIAQLTITGIGLPTGITKLISGISPYAI